MNGDDSGAITQYEKVIDTALGVSADAPRVAAIVAALDALSDGGVTMLEDASPHTALIDRQKDVKVVLAALQTSYGLGHDPFGKGLIARSLAERTAQLGDAQGAERWRIASGCARDVTVVGPSDWARVSSVKEGGPSKSSTRLSTRVVRGARTLRTKNSSDVRERSHVRARDLDVRNAPRASGTSSSTRTFPKNKTSV